MDSLEEQGRFSREGGLRWALRDFTDRDGVNSIQSGGYLKQRPRVRKKPEGLGNGKETSVAGVDLGFPLCVWMG